MLSCLHLIVPVVKMVNNINRPNLQREALTSSSAMFSHPSEMFFSLCNPVPMQVSTQIQYQKHCNI